MFITTEAKKESVLLIGNSLSKGLKIKGLRVKDMTKNNVPLAFFSQDKKSMKTIGSKKWDYVILQEQSSFLLNSRYQLSFNTIPSIRKIKEAISDKTQIFLIQTWPELDNIYYMTINEEYMRKNAIYIGDLLGIKVCFVGKEFIEHENYEKFYRDAKHPSKLGLKFYSKTLKFCLS